MERYFYGASGASGIESNNWMAMTEATTDLWTYQRNKSTSYTQWFWFYAGASPNTTYTDNFWSGIYDGIGACNIAISKVDKVPFKTEEARNAKVAEAHFLRAVYYFNAGGLHHFGGGKVVFFIKAGFQFHKYGDFLAVLGGGYQGVDDGGVFRYAVLSYHDFTGFRVVHGFIQEVDEVLERVIRVI